MSECDRTAVGIKLLVNIDTEILADCNRLSRKCLVGFDDIEVLDLISGLSHSLACSRNGTDTHDSGINACKSACNEGSHRLNTEFLSLLFAHNNHSCRTVVDTRCITCGYESVGIYRTELCKSFYCGTLTGTFIRIKYNNFFLLLNFHRNYLFLELAVLDSSAGLELALESKLIKFFPCKIPLPCDIISSCYHMIIIECIPEGILYHSINKTALALRGPHHPVTVTSVGDRKRRHRHVLHTACNNNIGISCHYHLCCLIDAVKTRSAYYIGSNCRCFNRKTCLDRCLAGNVLTLSCLYNTSHVYMLNILGLDPGPLNCFLDYDGSQISYGNG